GLLGGDTPVSDCGVAAGSGALAQAGVADPDGCRGAGTAAGTGAVGVDRGGGRRPGVPGGEPTLVGDQAGPVGRRRWRWARAPHADVNRSLPRGRPVRVSRADTPDPGCL